MYIFSSVNNIKFSISLKVFTIIINDLSQCFFTSTDILW